jgi:bifunctional DNA-binding transcriptional regulator/antitoxin component of YhaV-PrlF toxin-antitoxin module
MIMKTSQIMDDIKRYKVIAKVFSNGKVTLPIEVRQYLGVNDGDYVELIVSKMDMSVPSDNIGR